MKYTLSLLSLSLLSLLLALPGLLCAQGVSAAWDTSKDIASLIEQAERLNPLLEQLTPQQWEAQGAPATYTTQWRLARNEVVPDARPTSAATEK